MEKIGIVTITYNSADVLDPFLECIWKQSYQNFILYVIDNSSTDSTLQILEEEQDSRLKLIKNEINSGVARANNQGIKEVMVFKEDDKIYYRDEIGVRQKMPFTIDERLSVGDNHFYILARNSNGLTNSKSINIYRNQ